jgi:hypothetical protein
VTGSGEHQEEWIEIDVAVELHPWPNRDWLLWWQEGDLEWPEGLDEPVLDGRRLIFSAPAHELQEAWEAVKVRVDSANDLYREDQSHLSDDHEPDPAEQESLNRLRAIAQRRIDELD